MTALELIKRSLRILGVIQTGEELSADESADGLQVLNQMLHAWELDGIKLAHVDLDTSDTVAVTDDHLQPIAYNLALLLAPEYDVTPSNVVVAFADNGYTNLQNYYLEPPELSFDQSLNSAYKPNRYN